MKTGNCMDQHSRAVAILAVILLCASATCASVTSGRVVGNIMTGVAQFVGPSASRVMLGGFGYGSYNHFLVGVEGAYMYGNGTYQRDRYGLFSAGYALWTMNRWRAYPFVGLGYGRFSVDIPSDTRNPLFGIGVGANLRITPFAGGAIGRFMRTVGVRIGYLFRLENTNLNIVYLALALGGG